MSYNGLRVGAVSETQVGPFNPCTSLRATDGELLLSHAVLRPLRLLPLSTLQHHLPLLEDEPPVHKEDVEEAHECTDIHMYKHTPTHKRVK